MGVPRSRSGQTVKLNYFDWRYGSAEKEYRILVERNISIMVMELMRGGRFITLSSGDEKFLKTAYPDWSIASWSLRWEKRISQVQVILSGMSSIWQIQDNIKTFQKLEGLPNVAAELLIHVCEAFRNYVRTCGVVKMKQWC